MTVIRKIIGALVILAALAAAGFGVAVCVHAMNTEPYIEDGEDGPDAELLRRSIVTQLLIYCGRSIARVPETLPHRAEQRYHEVMAAYEYIDANRETTMKVLIDVDPEEE